MVGLGSPARRRFRPTRPLELAIGHAKGERNGRPEAFGRGMPPPLERGLAAGRQGMPPPPINPVAY